jgi:murein DD-endopeptidase MepM/ murein hydrolase activator NlpD
VRVLSGTKYGTYIRLDGDGFETVYAHLNGVDVEDGQHVEAGQKIGRVGSTGNSTGPHLHFGLRIDRVKNPAYGNYVDPMIGRLIEGDV